MSNDLIKLIRELYDKPRCAAGGPLHVQLDDGNLEDHFLQYESRRYNRLVLEFGIGWQDTGERDVSDDVVELCEKIRIGLLELPYAQRSRVVRQAFEDV